MSDDWHEQNRIARGAPRATKWSAPVTVMVGGKEMKRGRIVEFEFPYLKAFHRDVRPDLRVWVRDVLCWMIEPEIVAEFRKEISEGQIGEFHYHWHDGSTETLFVCTVEEMIEHGQIDLNGRMQCFRPVAEWRCEQPWYDVPGPDVPRPEPFLHEIDPAADEPKTGAEAVERIKTILGITPDKSKTVQPHGEHVPGTTVDEKTFFGERQEPPAEEPDKAKTVDVSDLPDVPF